VFTLCHVSYIQCILILDHVFTLLVNLNVRINFTDHFKINVETSSQCSDGYFEVKFLDFAILPSEVVLLNSSHFNNVVYCAGSVFYF